MPSRAVSEFTSRARSSIAEVYFDEMLDDLLVEEVSTIDDDAPAEIPGESTRTEASLGELTELGTWQRLIDLAECAGKERLAQAFRAALDEER
jgi:hypothetical protein